MINPIKFTMSDWRLVPQMFSNPEQREELISFLDTNTIYECLTRYVFDKRRNKMKEKMLKEDKLKSEKMNLVYGNFEHKIPPSKNYWKETEGYHMAHRIFLYRRHMFKEAEDNEKNKSTNNETDNINISNTSSVKIPFNNNTEKTNIVYSTEQIKIINELLTQNNPTKLKDNSGKTNPSKMKEKDDRRNKLKSGRTKRWRGDESPAEIIRKLDQLVDYDLNCLQDESQNDDNKPTIDEREINDILYGDKAKLLDQFLKNV